MPSNFSDPVVQALVASRVSLLFDDPWYGNILTRCEMFKKPDGDIEIVDGGRRLMFSDYGVSKLTPVELVGALRSETDRFVGRFIAAWSGEEASPVEREFFAAILNASGAVRPDQRPQAVVDFLEPLVELRGASATWGIGSRL